MPKAAIDTVRASRDGHQYHEAWLARRALGLLLPRDGLCGIAVEGLSVDDQEDASAATIEIADATFYYGSAPNFRDATHIEIAQFKYSIAREADNFSASDAAKTLKKFAQSEAAFLSKPAQSGFAEKITYRIYTNRPVGPELIEALSSLAKGTVPSENKTRSQYNQLVAAIPLGEAQRRAFSAKVTFLGQDGDLRTIEKGNARIIADWSTSNDVLARARLGGLRQLVRTKAGHAGHQNNIITNIDVLAELDIAQESDLLPTPEAFAEPGPIVQREQLQQFIDGLGTSGLWIVHAAGGVGKTVFIQSAASRLNEIDEVVVFDCFGGGAYRSPLDMRHRPEQGLMHIVNELACRGLCDPILPGAADPAGVVRQSIKRFSDAINVLRRVRRTARLIIIIDAADNAAMEAKDRGQTSFPQMLLESLSYQPVVDGLICIATARPERRDLAIGRSLCKDFALCPFSVSESTSFITERRPQATISQIEAIHRRSNGNPRVMANLIEPDRSLAGVDAIPNAIDLNELIQERIKKAIRLADDKGNTRDEISRFLCALSVLPPPVPIDEIAIAFGVPVSEIESFAADLSPLLERTRHGLIFRDEPTETLVRASYGQQLSLLDGVVSRLTSAQASSVYAARSLPGLLFAMGRTDLLRTLALDTRFPPELTSDLAKQAIRLNRIRTAVGAAAKDRDFNVAVDLLVELASLVIVDERGEDFLLEQPDLAVGLGDPEALRRLVEARTGWPGTRHARLATAYTADDDTAEAHGHVIRADDWHRWHQGQDEAERQRSGPNYSDYASIAFYLFVKGRVQNVISYISQWKPHFGFLVANRMFEYCVATEAFGNLPKIKELLNEIVESAETSPALSSAALTAFPEFLARSAVKALMKKIAAKLHNSKDWTAEFSHTRHEDTNNKALMRCVVQMANLGMAKEVQQTLQIIEPERYGMWSLREAWNAEQLVPFAMGLASRCANESRIADFFDCLPKELWVLVEDAPRPLTDKAQREILDERLKELKRNKEETTIEIEERRKKSTLSSSEQHHVADRISRGVIPLLTVIRHLTFMISAEKSSEKKAATAAFFEAWEATHIKTNKRSSYIQPEHVAFNNALYRACAHEIFTALDLLTPTSASQLVRCLEGCQILAPESVIHFVKRLSTRTDCHSHSGQLAALAVRLIEHEGDVQQRTQLFAQLARALLRANRTEAALIFKRGLEELDAIGSGDDDFTYELLNFAATLRGGGLQPSLALRLAKICEINIQNSRKWDWQRTAEAFACASGPGYLAQIARWHDRGKGSLNRTLPPALAQLVKDSSLSPAIAVSLLWLIDLQFFGQQEFANLIKIFIEQGASDSILHEALDQYEYAFPKRLDSRHLCELRTAFEDDPKIAARFAERLTRLAQRSNLPRKVETIKNSSSSSSYIQKSTRKKEKEKHRAILEEALSDINPTDVASFENFVEKLEELPGWPFDKSQAYKTLRDRVAYADRMKHLEVIIAARNLELSEKCDLLQVIKEEWKKDSPTQLAIFSKYGLQLVREHADELLGETWGFRPNLFKLSEVTNTPADDLAIALVEASTTRELNAAATTWLITATILSSRADATVPRRALERLLDGGATRLTDEIGDGPWCDELNPGTSSDDIISGLLWFGLGSPSDKERWRAAHAVRSLARYKQWSIIDRMFVLLGASHDAGAFQDRSLPFFKLHAQLWFLLAIARVAIDHPHEVVKFRPNLEAIAFNDTFPHIGIREAACEALRHCTAEQRGMRRFQDRLSKINSSPFPITKTRGSEVRDFHWERPKDVPEPKSRFYFDYDFEKYELTELARVFGLPKWRMNDLCIKWVHEWSPTVTSMSDFSGREQPYSRHGYYSPTREAYQSHGTYLTWHALAVVGGQLLSERPVTNESYYDNPWQEWLSKYRISRKDGYWVSDGTKHYPLVALHDLKTGIGSDVERNLPINDKAFLSSLIGLGVQPSEDLIMKASWSSPDDVNCSVMSCLVSPAHAELTALAIATSPPFHMGLPYYESHDEEGEYFQSLGIQPCEPWITCLQHSENLDMRDPFGASSALSSYRPTQSIIKHFQLTVTEPWSQIWIDRNGLAVFRYEGWGGWQGDGDDEGRDEGRALYCNSNFLSKVLTELDRSLIVLIKLQHYQEKNRYGHEGEADEKFKHSFMVAIIDKNLHVHVVEPTNKQAEALAELGEHDIYDFSRRYQTLTELG